MSLQNYASQNAICKNEWAWLTLKLSSMWQNLISHIPKSASYLLSALWNPPNPQSLLSPPQSDENKKNHRIQYIQTIKRFFQDGPFWWSWRYIKYVPQYSKIDSCASAMYCAVHNHKNKLTHVWHFCLDNFENRKKICRWIELYEYWL